MHLQKHSTVNQLWESIAYYKAALYVLVQNQQVNISAEELYFIYYYYFLKLTIVMPRGQIPGRLCQDTMEKKCFFYSYWMSIS